MMHQSLVDVTFWGGENGLIQLEITPCDVIRATSHLMTQIGLNLLLEGLFTVELKVKNVGRDFSDTHPDWDVTPKTP